MRLEQSSTADRVADKPAGFLLVGGIMPVVSSLYRRLIRPLSREPLTGFAIAGCLVFLLFHWLSDGGREQILVTRAMMDDMLSYRAELLDRPLSDDEKATVVEEFVNREILLREAVARGLHRQDSQVRKRLIEKMNFLLEEEPGEPTTAQLETLYQSDPRRFHSPPLISFEHVYFKSSRQRALETLAGIRRGEIDPDTAGETFWLGRRLEYYSTQDLLTLFGFEFVKQLRSAAIGEWQGPIKSGRGQHLVRVLERRQPQPLPQAELQQNLEREWIRLQRLESRATRLQVMRGNYRIVLPDDPGGNR